MGTPVYPGTVRTRVPVSLPSMMVPILLYIIYVVSKYAYPGMTDKYLSTQVRVVVSDRRLGKPQGEYLLHKGT